MLGIIGAMDVEVAAVKAKICDEAETVIAGITFVCGYIENVMLSRKSKRRNLCTDYDR